MFSGPRENVRSTEEKIVARPGRSNGSMGLPGRAALEVVRLCCTRPHGYTSAEAVLVPKGADLTSHCYCRGIGLISAMRWCNG